MKHGRGLGPSGKFDDVNVISFAKFYLYLLDKTTAATVLQPFSGKPDPRNQSHSDRVAVWPPEMAETPAVSQKPIKMEMWLPLIANRKA